MVEKGRQWFVWLSIAFGCFLEVNFSSFAPSSCFQRHLLLRRVGGCLVVFCCNWLPLVVFFCEFVWFWLYGCMVIYCCYWLFSLPLVVFFVDLVGSVFFGWHLLLSRVDGCSWLFILVLGCFFFVFSWFWSVWLFWATLVVGQGGRCGDWGEGKAAGYLSGNSTHFNVGPRLSSIDDDFINEFDDNDIVYVTLH